MHYTAGASRLGERSDHTVPTLDELPATPPLPDEDTKRRALATVAFTLFLDLLGFGIILPILPFYAESMHASETVVALLSTAFSAAQFIMAPVLGRISDRYGRRPVMLVSIAGSVVAALVLGFATALWLVFLARIVAGSSKANVSTAHAYVADVVPGADRAKYMGRMGAAMGMGFVIGPGVGGFLGHYSPQLPFFVSAGLSFINLLMAAAWLPETNSLRRRDQPDASASGSSVRSALMSSAGLRRALLGLRGTHMAWLVAIVFCFYLSFAAMESTLALFGERVFEWGARETGNFMVYIGINMVLFQGLIVGRAVSRFGEAKTLALGLMMVAIALLLLGGVGHLSQLVGFELLTDGHTSAGALVVYAAGGLFLAGGNGLTSATLSALVSRVSSEDEQGWNMGIKESSASLARVAGPVMGGPLLQYVDPGAPMIAGGLIALINTNVALLLYRRLRKDRLQ